MKKRKKKKQKKFFQIKLKKFAQFWRSILFQVLYGFIILRKNVILNSSGFK